MSAYEILDPTHGRDAPLNSMSVWSIIGAAAAFALTIFIFGATAIPQSIAANDQVASIYSP
jgi:hypothetical protein